jgi:hypothetical protein
MMCYPLLLHPSPAFPSREPSTHAITTQFELITDHLVGGGTMCNVNFKITTPLTSWNLP